MPNVRMLQSVAGDRFHWDEGQEVEMDDESAAIWADGIRGQIVTPERTPPRRSRPGVETR